jgi:hypothetical protein
MCSATGSTVNDFFSCLPDHSSHARLVVAHGRRDQPGFLLGQLARGGFAEQFGQLVGLAGRVRAQHRRQVRVVNEFQLGRLLNPALRGQPGGRDVLALVLVPVIGHGCVGWMGFLPGHQYLPVCPPATAWTTGAAVPLPRQSRCVACTHGCAVSGRTVSLKALLLMFSF